MKKIFLLLLLGLGSFQDALLAVESCHISDSQPTTDYWQWIHALYPLAPTPTPLEGGCYREAKRILLLGDSFIYGVGYEPLAHDLSSITPDNAEIYKTSLDCPRKLDNIREGKIVNLVLDHTQRLPFDDNAFDTIVMKRGLCHCYPLKLNGEINNQTCGGINFMYNKEQPRSFLEELIRVLNKDNPQAVIFLHGRHLPLCSRENLSLRLSLTNQQQQKTVEVLSEISEQASQDYPQLKFVMTYTTDDTTNSTQPCSSFFGLRISVRD